MEDIDFEELAKNYPDESLELQEEINSLKRKLDLNDGKENKRKKN